MSVYREVHSRPHQGPDNLVSALRCQAEKNPDQPGFIHLQNDLSNQAVMTYARLEQRACAIAAHLQDMGISGQRVLLVYSPGLDFITAFFGCLYAGCVAVPTYPPHRSRMIVRFQAIAADAGAGIALSTSFVVGQIQSMMARKDGHAAAPPPIQWVSTDDIADGLSGRWSEPVITAETLAMLQYTSGSTSHPKGVMLSHGNLLDNTCAIRDAFGTQPQDSAVFWLPTYHDMGLVGGVLVPVLAGGTNILISPVDFLQKPIRWLEAVSKYRATISGGPNFAYDLCVRMISDQQRAALDLSCWSLAFIGAEPIEPATLERFAAAFAPCGFSPGAFYPCYGLAEATLMVTGAQRGSGATIEAFDNAGLTQHKALPAPDNAESRTARRLVACGTPVGTAQVVIVNPDTQTEVKADGVGEIWVAGPSVGQGYWHNPGLIDRSFNARLDDTGDGPFLRTGDLGFIHKGQLYVTGRRDDVMIVRGLNRYPHDIEATARSSHPLLDVGYGAAFAVDDHGHQCIVLVQETRNDGKTDFEPILNAIRAAVIDEHELALDAVALVRIGTIPKTSSGKVQRNACRQAFVSGSLKTLADYNSTRGSGDTDTSRPHSPPSSAFAVVCQHARTLAGAALPELTPETPVHVLGLDSLQRLELIAAIEKNVGGTMPETAYTQAHTLGQLAEAVQKYLIEGLTSGALAGRSVPREYDVTQFSEYVQLKRHEQLLLAVGGENPYFRVDQGGAGNSAVVEGRQLINFCVYDYVGMAHDPKVVAAAKAAIDRYGTGAGASRLISGEKQVHRDLEQALAEFYNVPAALVFVSGHATNVTTLGHLLGPDDLILHDTLAHNSIIQGAQLSGATRRMFAHNDWKALDAALSESRHRYRRVLVAIEGVYSMDGDFPELPRFVELKKKHAAMMLVDEAHSLGTMGATGRGIGEHWGIDRTDVDLWMGTLSKSLASCGGFIAGSAEMVEYLKYTAPGFVYSVGISPANAAAALAALTMLQHQPQRIKRLGALAALFLERAKQAGLDTGLSCGTPVVPIIVGSSIKALRLSNALFRRGIYVQPILYPVVPEDSARLRFFITTNHSEAQIHATISAIADELKAIDQPSGPMSATEKMHEHDPKCPGSHQNSEAP